ncbi:hypothetical protein KM043_003839 [Ampulex compressa]|nr:hypothetical protein KM043_003839 [Ampulex compressa]
MISRFPRWERTLLEPTAGGPSVTPSIACHGNEGAKRLALARKPQTGGKAERRGKDSELLRAAIRPRFVPRRAHFWSIVAGHERGGLFSSRRLKKRNEIIGFYPAGSFEDALPLPPPCDERDSRSREAARNAEKRAGKSLDAAAWASVRNQRSVWRQVGATDGEQSREFPGKPAKARFALSPRARPWPSGHFFLFLLLSPTTAPPPSRALCILPDTKPRLRSSLFRLPRLNKKLITSRSGASLRGKLSGGRTAYKSVVEDVGGVGRDFGAGSTPLEEGRFQRAGRSPEGGPPTLSVLGRRGRDSSQRSRGRSCKERERRGEGRRVEELESDVGPGLVGVESGSRRPGLGRRRAARYFCRGVSTRHTPEGGKRERGGPRGAREPCLEGDNDLCSR